MDFRKQLYNNIISVVFVMTLMIPAAVQFSHIFEEHEHVACKEQTVHIHTDVSECEICYFHFSSLAYDIVQYPNLLLTKIYVAGNASLISLQFHSFTVTNTQLRAPPLLLT